MSVIDITTKTEIAPEQMRLWTHDAGARHAGGHRSRAGPKGRRPLG